MARPKSTKVYLSDDVIRDEKQEIKRLEKMLEADRQRGEHRKIVDEGLFKKELAERKKKVEEGTPHKFPVRQQNRAYDEAKKLKGEIQEALQPANKFYTPYPSNRSSTKRKQQFDEAVQHEVRIMRDPELQKKMQRYKSLMAQIDPSDPRIRNIENLRK